MITNSCVKLQTVHTIPMTMNKEGKEHSIWLFGLLYQDNSIFNSDRSHYLTDDESPGLYGFLNVIVHSASGLKHSLSMLVFVFTVNHIPADANRWHVLYPPCLTLSLSGPSAGRAAAGVGLAWNTVYKPLQICLSHLTSVPAYFFFTLLSTNRHLHVSTCSEICRFLYTGLL